MESHTPSTPVAVHHSTITSAGLHLAILAGALFAPALSLQAATATWNGGSITSPNWSVIGNWGTATAAPGSTSSTTNTDTAVFNSAISNTWGNSAANPVVIDSTSQNIKSITFDSNAGSYFIGSTSGNSLLLTSGGTIQITSAVTTGITETINAPLVLEGNYSFANNNANAGTTLNFGGGITSGAASGTTTLTLTGANTGVNTISGVIANGNTAAVAVTKAGAGTWVLSGANTYTGPTIINDGVLKLGATNAIATTGTLTINETTAGNTATLNLNGYNQTLASMTFGGTGGTSTSTNAVTGSGTLTLNGSITFTNTGLPLGATISTTALDLGGGTRNFVINDSVNAAYDLTISANIQNGSVNKTGAGALYLTGSNQQISTTLGAGTLVIGNDHALGSGTLVFSAGVVQTDSSATRTVSNNVAVGAGAMATFSGPGDLAFGGMTLNSGLSTGTVATNVNVTVASLSGINGSGQVSQGVSLAKQGAKALIITGNDSRTGSTDIQGGTLAVVGSLASGAVKLDGGVLATHGTFTRSLSSGSVVQWIASTSGGFAAYGSSSTWGDTSNNLTVKINNGTSTLTWGSTTNFISSGQTLFLGSTISNGTVDFQNGLDLAGTTQTVQVEHAIANTAKGVDAILSGTISNGGLTKTGSGTLKLSAANTYSGATSVNAGKLLVTGSLSATSSVSVASTAELSVAGLINQSAIITLDGKLTGTGTVGAVTVGATGVVSAGDDSIGTLKTGDFTLASTSSVTFDLTSGNTAIGGGINDLIAITGNLTLDGTLVVNSGETLANGRYTLFTYTGTLTNNTIDLSPTFLSTYEGSYIDTSIGNQVALVVVPEPSTWAFLAGGLGLLAFVQRLRYGKRDAKC